MSGRHTTRRSRTLQFEGMESRLVFSTLTMIDGSVAEPAPVVSLNDNSSNLDGGCTDHQSQLGSRALTPPVLRGLVSGPLSVAPGDGSGDRAAAAPGAGRVGLPAGLLGWDDEAMTGDLGDDFAIDDSWLAR